MAFNMHSTQRWAAAAVVTTTGLDKQSRQQVQDSVEAAGGAYSAALHKGCTHVIASTRLTEPTDKLCVAASNAARWKVDVVTPAWWCDSVRKGQLLPAEGYHLPLMQALSSPTGTSTSTSTSTASTAAAGVPAQQLQPPWHVHFSQIPTDGGVYPAAPTAAAPAPTAAAAAAGAGTTAAAQAAARPQLALNREPLQPAAAQQQSVSPSTDASSWPAVSPTRQRRASVLALVLPAPPTSQAADPAAAVPAAAYKRSSMAGSSNAIGVQSDGIKALSPSSRAFAAGAQPTAGAPRRHTDEVQPRPDVSELLQQLSSSRFLRRNSTQGYSRRLDVAEGAAERDTAEAATAGNPAAADASRVATSPSAADSSRVLDTVLTGRAAAVQASLAALDSMSGGAGGGGGNPMVSMDFRRLLGQLHVTLTGTSDSSSSNSPAANKVGQQPQQQQQQAVASSPGGGQRYTTGDVRSLVQQLHLAAAGDATAAAELPLTRGAEAPPAASTRAVEQPQGGAGSNAGNQGYMSGDVATLLQQLHLAAAQELPAPAAAQQQVDSAQAQAQTGDLASRAPFGWGPASAQPSLSSNVVPAPQQEQQQQPRLVHAQTLAADTAPASPEGRLPQRRRHTVDMVLQRPIPQNAWAMGASISPGTAGTTAAAVGADGSSWVAAPQTTNGMVPAAAAAAAAADAVGGQDLQHLLAQLRRCSAPGAAVAAMAAADGRGAHAKCLGEALQPSAAAESATEAATLGAGESLEQLLQRLNSAAAAAAEPAPDTGAGPASGQLALGSLQPAVEVLQPTLSCEVAELLAAVRRATGDHPPSAADAAAALPDAVAAATGTSLGPSADVAPLAPAAGSSADAAGDSSGVDADTASDKSLQQVLAALTALAGQGQAAGVGAEPAAGSSGHMPATAVEGSTSTGNTTALHQGIAGANAPPFIRECDPEQRQQQPRSRRTSRPSLLLLLPESGQPPVGAGVGAGAGAGVGAGAGASADLSILRPVSPKLTKPVLSPQARHKVALGNRGNPATQASPSAQPGGSEVATSAQDSMVVAYSPAAASSSGSSSSSWGISFKGAVVFLDPALPADIAEQLQQGLRGACATLAAAAHLGSPVTLVVTEPSSAASWLHLSVDVVSPTWCLSQLQQAVHGSAIGAEGQLPPQQQLVRLSPDVARAVWRASKQRSLAGYSSSARSSAGGGAASSRGYSLPQQQAEAATSSGQALSSSTTQNSSSSSSGATGSASQQQQQQVAGLGWLPPVLLSSISWSVLDAPEAALTAEELESNVLQGLPGGITLLLPQGPSPLLGQHALQVGADTAAGGVSAGRLLRSIYGFYQQPIQVSADLLAALAGTEVPASCCQLSQVAADATQEGTQASQAGGGSSGGAGGGKYSVTVARGALLGAGVWFAGLERWQRAPHSPVYCLRLG